MKDKILEVLKEFNEDLVNDMEQDLIATGILDSFDIIKLVVELEDAFDIVIGVEDVIPENFHTANDIIRLVERVNEK